MINHKAEREREQTQANAKATAKAYRSTGEGLLLPFFRHSLEVSY
jgi:hypothetical protein